MIPKKSNAQCDSTYIAAMIRNGQWIADYLWSFETISVEQEEKIGDEMHESMGLTEETSSNNEQQKWLQTILDKLTPFVKRADVHYDIHLIEDDALINAFSIAGGHLYVTTGLLNLIENEDELAFVIGHEIGHVDLEHCITQVKRNISIQRWADYFELGEYAGIAEYTQAILGTPFGQAHEYTADRAGAYLSWKAGYDYEKGKEFLNKLESIEMESTSNTELSSDLEVLFRTHPYSAQRVQCLDYYINNEMK